jgi:hypothetical protein
MPTIPATQEAEIKAKGQLKIAKRARHWWVMPVILATQEADIRRILVQSQPRQIVLETLSQKKPFTHTKKGW